MNTRTIVTRSFTAALVLAAAASFAAAPARAWERPGNLSWADGRLVDVQVRVAGRAAPLYVSPQADDRRYLQAFAGRNYSLVIRNNSGERVGVLVAVDGLNVVNGEKSALRATEAMYVLAPYETATIDGWRTSLDDIRRFVFVDEARSYAARTGQANGDMGWIRVLAFREQRPIWRELGTRWGNRHDDLRADEAPPSSREPMAAAPAPTMQDLRSAPEMKSRANAMEGDQSFPGTGWGQHQNDRVEQVRFTAERRATDMLVFRYEYASGLRALGIFPDRDRLRERDNGGALGFAKPPRW